MRFSENRKLALIILAVVIAIAILGGGGGALVDKRSEITQVYLDSAYSISAELNEMRVNADTLVSIAKKYDQANQDYIDEMNKALSALVEARDPAEAYRVSVALSSAVEHCYSDLTGLQLSSMDAEDARYKYKNFSSALMRISHDRYNGLASAFNRELARFPANLIGGVCGVKSLSLFQ